MYIDLYRLADRALILPQATLSQERYRELGWLRGEMRVFAVPKEIQVAHGNGTLTDPMDFSQL